MNNMIEPVRIEKLILGGQGLGTLPSGKKVFFWGALPGELVTNWQVVKNKSNFLEAIADRVVETSEFRLRPKDPCFLATSPWQIMEFPYELSQKRKILFEILRQHRVDIRGITVPDTATDGKDFFYRNKMEYALYYDNDEQKIYPAFRGRGSHRKIPVLQSSLEHSAIWQRAQEVLSKMNETGDEARKYQSLLLRCNQKGEVSGGLLENNCPHPEFPSLRDVVFGREYTYSPNGFFQVNLPVYELALEEIQKWIATEKVLDLYAGVGTIGLSVARDKKLVLVECDKAAYVELEKNCADTAAQPVLAKSEEALEYIAPDQTVIVDPPRAGCFPSVIEKFLEIMPERIIYLSCNPVTQARDVAQLVSKYRILQVYPFNFFPRTPHLENLMVLERRPVENILAEEIQIAEKPEIPIEENLTKVSSLEGASAAEVSSIETSTEQVSTTKTKHEEA